MIQDVSCYIITIESGVPISYTLIMLIIIWPFVTLNISLQTHSLQYEDGVIVICDNHRCHHSGCRCPGAKQAPGHQQPLCWLHCDSMWLHCDNMYIILQPLNRLHDKGQNKPSLLYPLISTYIKNMEYNVMKLLNVTCISWSPKFRVWQ